MIFQIAEPKTSTIGIWALVPMLIGIFLFIWMYRKIAKFGDKYMMDFIARKEKEYKVKIVYHFFSFHQGFTIQGKMSEQEKTKLYLQITLGYAIIYFTPLIIVATALILLIPHDVMNMRFS